MDRLLQPFVSCKRNEFLDAATLVEARTDSPFGKGGSVVFEPSREWLDGTGLEAEDSNLTMAADGCVSVLVKNPTVEAMRLTSGTPVGRVEPFGQWAQLSVTNRSPDNASDQAGCVCTTTAEEQESGKEDSQRLKLSEKLNVSGEGLTPEQTQIIWDCVL